MLDDAFHFLQQHYPNANGKHRSIIVPQIIHPLQQSSSAEDESPEQHSAEPPRIFVLSSYDQAGVFRIRDQYLEHVASNSSRLPPVPEHSQWLSDLSYTLACKRTHHGWRSSFLASSLIGLRKSLSTISPPTKALAEPRLAFVFTGQGAQWPAMSKDLLVFQSFKQSLDNADRYLQSLGCHWSLMGMCILILIQPTFGAHMVRLQMKCSVAQIYHELMTRSSVNRSVPLFRLHLWIFCSA